MTASSRTPDAPSTDGPEREGDGPRAADEDRPTRARWRTGLGRSVLGLCLVPLAAAPALAEHLAQRRLETGLERCRLGAADPDAPARRCVAARRADFDLDGAHLYDVRARWDDGGAQASIDRVDLGLRDGGWQLRASGVEGHIEPSAARRANATRRDLAVATADAPRRSPPEAAESWRARLERDLRRWPLRLDMDGHVDLRMGAHLVRVEDPSVHRDPDGSLEGRLDVTLRRGEETLAEGRDVRVHGNTERLGQVDLEGVLALSEGDEVGVRGAVDPRDLELQFATRRGGQAWVTVPGWRSPSRAALRFDALDLGPLDPLRGLLGEHVRVDLQHTRLSGGLDVQRVDGPVEALTLEFDRLGVDGLVLESGHLARDPLYLEDLQVDGRLELRGREAMAGELAVRHGKARATLRGAMDEARVNLAAELNRMGCQDFLGSMPAGLVPMLEGTRLDGTLAARFALDFRWDDLAARRDAEARTGEPQPPPGELAVEFPFLEDCRVQRDAPGVSVAALAGPYRHRFLSDSGREITRVFDPVDPHWVRLEEVGVLARAFVTLEDVGFWRHDGFDREQMARAFWHDLSASRFSRGASTITQQTARNLWLGIDRSVGRKLQEAVYASRLEAELDKRRILEIYLNIIELGPEVHGVHEAAYFHFGRGPHELNLLEAVHLASLAPGPVMYSERFASGEIDEAWSEHLREQLRRMRIHGLISREQEWAAARSELRLLDRRVEPAGDHASAG